MRQKTKAGRKEKSLRWKFANNRMPFALIGSLVVHAFLVVWASRRDTAKPAEQLFMPVTISITHSKKPPVAAVQKNETSATVHSLHPDAVAKDKKRAAKKTVATVAAQPSYTDLLPLAPPSQYPQIAAADDDSSAASTSSWRPHDPEGEEFSQDRKMRNLMSLERFASELAERISVPRTFIKLVGSGESFLRYKKDGEVWDIRTVTGNRFLRATIYEAFKDIKDSTFMNALLSKIDYSSIRIYFSYATGSALDPSIKPVDIRTEANKIFLTVTHRTASSLWKLGMPIDNETTDDTVLPNLIGIGALFLDSMSDGTPVEGSDVKRLRQSPAFVRPIGR